MCYVLDYDINGHGIHCSNTGFKWQTIHIPIENV